MRLIPSDPRRSDSHSNTTLLRVPDLPEDLLDRELEKSLDIAVWASEHMDRDDRLSSIEEAAAISFVTAPSAGRSVEPSLLEQYQAARALLPPSQHQAYLKQEQQDFFPASAAFPSWGSSSGVVIGAGPLRMQQQHQIAQPVPKRAVAGIQLPGYHFNAGEAGNHAFGGGPLFMHLQESMMNRSRSTEPALMSSHHERPSSKRES